MLKEVRREDIPGARRGTRGYAVAAIQEFLGSGMGAAKFDPPSGARSAYVSLIKARSRMEAPVDVMIRRGAVYLVRREEKS